MHFTVKQMTLCALCAALISVLSPLAIPLAGQVPISLATLAVMVAASLEGPFLSAVSVIIYIFLGIIGIPVFAGYSSGAAIAFGMRGDISSAISRLPYAPASPLKNAPHIRIPGKEEVFCSPAW